MYKIFIWQYVSTIHSICDIRNTFPDLTFFTSITINARRNIFLKSHSRTWENSRVDPHRVFSATFTRECKTAPPFDPDVPHILSLLFARYTTYLRGMLGISNGASRLRQGLPTPSSANPPRIRSTKDNGLLRELLPRASRRRRRPARNTKSYSKRRECRVVEKIGRNTRGRCAHLYPGNTNTIHSITSPVDLNAYPSEFREFFA